MTYRFLHDRLQQAAMALLDATTRREYNLRLGMRRLASYKLEPNSAGLFAVLEQLGAATELFVQRHHERVAELIVLNLEGARTAKNSAAFKVALAYLKTARVLLGDAPAQRALLSRVILDQADCEYSSGQVDAALHHLQGLQGNDIPLELRAAAGRLRVQALTAVGRFEQAIESGIQSLKGLGLTLPKHPGRVQTTLAVNVGDQIYAAWASARVPAATLMLSLSDAWARARQYRAFTAGTSLEQQGMLLRGVQFFAARLADWPDAVNEGDPVQADEGAYQLAVQSLGGTAAAQEAVFACMRAYVEQDFAKACGAVALAMQLNVFRVLSSSFCMYLCVWGLLAHSAAQLQGRGSPAVQGGTRRRMRAKLTSIAQAGPEHHGWLHDFLVLLTAVRRGDARTAMHSGDLAAQKLGHAHMHGARAAVLEHLAQALEAQGFGSVADSSRAQAAEAYALWGARGKSRSLGIVSRLATQAMEPSAAHAAPLRQHDWAALAAAPDLETLLQQAAAALDDLSFLEGGPVPMVGTQGAGPLELMQM